MTDVFISYARSTEGQAHKIAAALRNLGYGVWRDDELPAHRDYSEVIEERLRAAKAVVVVWSAEAVKSHWVRAEADLAREGGTLVQLRLDHAPLPMPFNRIQCADLAGWTGDVATPGWLKVAASVRDLVGSSPSGADHLTTRPPTEPLLAVLAFDNLSADPEMTFFSDGVSEEIQTTLARGTQLRVIGRTSAFQLRARDKTVRNAVAELKATHVLDGSVRRAGPRVRVTAQLIECASETTLWSDRFDHDLTDVFALQDEVAAAVSEALKITFAPSTRPATIDPNTYEKFLRAQALMYDADATLADPEEDAISLLETVVREEPTFARAWATLSMFRAVRARSDRSRLTYDEARAGVLEAVETALKLDRHQAAPYCALAQMEPWAAFSSQETLLRNALAAEPNATRALGDLAGFCWQVGRLREALDFANRARELNPILPIEQNLVAALLGQLGRYDECLAVYESCQDRWPLNRFLVSAAMTCAAIAGDWTRFDRWTPDLNNLDPTGIAFVQGALRLGSQLRQPDPAARQERLDTIRSALTQAGTVRIDALVELGLYGLTDEAFKLAEQASFAHMFIRDGVRPSGHYNFGVMFGARPGMAADRRFVALCAKMGLCDYWVATDQWPDVADQVPYDFRAEAKNASRG